MKNLIILILLGSSQLVFALNPSRTYKQKPEKYKMEYKEAKIKTNDGKAELNTWYFPSKEKTTKLILISHNGEGNMGDYLRRVDQFTSIGYNVMAYDYRGFGESSAFEIDNDKYIYPHFQDDLETMMDYCSKQHATGFDVYGWGIGAGLSLGIGWNRTDINKIIADTPFLSMEDLELRFSSWDKPMKVPTEYEKKYEPVHALGKPFAGKSKEVFLIIGSDDKLFSQKDMAKLKEQGGKVIQDIFVVENPDRKDNFQINMKNYMSKVSQFLAGK